MKDAAKFMAIAREEALLGISRGDGGPFGAVLVRNDEVVSRAHNEVMLRNDPTAHAEVLAIRRASRTLGRPHLEGCTLFTTCEPCPMCLGAVAWARIPRVYFGCTRFDAEAIGFSDREIYELIADNLTPPPVERVSLEREKCMEIFQAWAERPDHELY